MGLLMAYWELMARYYDRHGGVSRTSRSWRMTRWPWNFAAASLLDHTVRQ
jgi:hypothetical protein